ncbi:MAG: cytochrome c, partial [Acidimicrobiia bacterium]
LVPLFALFALGSASTGECGQATELMTDVVTGDIVNCDGSAFTGQSVGGGGTDFVALGADIYAGAEVSGVNCSGCHGVGGQGSGPFPALTGVLTTFSACADHVEWVGLGSSGFQAAGENSYGDTSKPITGGMPSFSSNLTEEQIAAVSAFERVRFGGGDPDQILVDCGLADEDAGGEEGTEESADNATEGGEDSEASAGYTG